MYFFSRRMLNKLSNNKEESYCLYILVEKLLYMLSKLFSLPNLRKLMGKLTESLRKKKNIFIVMNKLNLYISLIFGNSMLDFDYTIKSNSKFIKLPFIFKKITKNS
jgi:hypothetical protein